MFERYIGEIRKKENKDYAYVLHIERLARLCVKDYIAVSYLPAEQYEFMRNRNINNRYRRVYSYLWKEQDIFPVIDIFRRFDQCRMFGELCCKSLMLAPTTRPYTLNFRMRIKRCFLKNEESNEYDTLLPEEWMTAAYKETQYGWTDTEVQYAKQNYAFKTYYTNNVMFIMYDRTDRINSLRILTCPNCLRMLEKMSNISSIHCMLH